MSRLTEEKNIWLCTVREDGRPHLTPIWFVFHADRFWIGTGADGVKTRNVRRNPKVSLSLENGNDPVVAEGTVVVHESPFPADVIDAFIAKFGWDIGRGEDEDVGTIVLWEITVDRWLMGGPA
jgi:F420H(2)-dependent biliverdin reductase